VPEFVFGEARQINALSFKYAEPPEPQNFATGAAGALPFYEPRQWVTGPALLAEGAAAPLATILARTASPDDAIFVLTAPKLPGGTPYTEPIYGTRYGELDISKECTAWRRAPRLEGLALPTPNRFVPKVLDIKPPPKGAPAAGRGRGGGGGGAAVARARPAVVVAAPSVRLHHLQDVRFQLPRGFAFFELRTPVVMASAADAVAAELCAACLAAPPPCSTPLARPPSPPPPAPAPPAIPSPP
jgi:insulysin